MEKRAISTDNAPEAKGPYSQGIAVGNFLFLSGQIYLDPAKGVLIKRSIEVEPQRVMENLKAILESQRRESRTSPRYRGLGQDFGGIYRTYDMSEEGWALLPGALAQVKAGQIVCIGK